MLQGEPRAAGLCICALPQQPGHDCIPHLPGHPLPVRAARAPRLVRCPTPMCSSTCSLIVLRYLSYLAINMNVVGLQIASSMLCLLEMVSLCFLLSLTSAQGPFNWQDTAFALLMGICSNAIRKDTLSRKFACFPQVVHKHHTVAV